MSQAPDIAAGRLAREAYDRNFADLHPPLSRTRPASPPSAACSATTRPASRPARPRSTSRCSSARSRPATRRARPRRSSMPTSWAACAPASARPRPCARRSACARRPRASRSRSAGCSATRPTPCSRPAASSTARDRRPGSAWPWSAPGPAGLACAHKLATLGHEVVVFEAREKGRRPQRVRHRRLQDAWTGSRSARSTTSWASAASSCARACGSAATSRSPICAATTTPCSSASAWAR